MSEGTQAKDSYYRMQGVIVRQLISMDQDVRRMSKAIIGQQITPDEALVQLESMAAFLHIAIGAAHAERERMRGGAE